MKAHHRRFLEVLMGCVILTRKMTGCERQCLLNAHPCLRTDARVDQANGF
jgi:hypothetical protein